LTHHVEQSGEEAGAVPADSNLFSALRAEAEELFGAAGLMTKEVRDRVTRVACGGVAFEALTTAAQMKALIRMLRNRAAPPGEPVAAVGAGE
jgi:hypothetical protein